MTPGVGAKAYLPFRPSLDAKTSLLWWQLASRGGSVKRLLADFIVGAHALIRADGLLTLDAGRHAKDFPERKQMIGFRPSLKGASDLPRPCFPL